MRELLEGPKSNPQWLTKEIKTVLGQADATGMTSDTREILDVRQAACCRILNPRTASDTVEYAHHPDLACQFFAKESDCRFRVTNRRSLQIIDLLDWVERGNGAFVPGTASPSHTATSPTGSAIRRAVSSQHENVTAALNA